MSFLIRSAAIRRVNSCPSTIGRVLLRQPQLRTLSWISTRNRLLPNKYMSQLTAISNVQVFHTTYRPFSVQASVATDTTTRQFNISQQTNREYEIRSEETLDSLTCYLEELMEELNEPSYDVTYSQGVLTIQLGQHGTFVLNKQPPNKQIWLSSPLSGPKRYDYDANAGVWFYNRDQSILQSLLDKELSELLGVTVDTSNLSSHH